MVASQSTQLQRQLPRPSCLTDGSLARLCARELASSGLDDLDCSEGLEQQCIHRTPRVHAWAERLYGSTWEFKLTVDGVYDVPAVPLSGAEKQLLWDAFAGWVASQRRPLLLVADCYTDDGAWDARIRFFTKLGFRRTAGDHDLELTL